MGYYTGSGIVASGGSTGSGGGFSLPRSGGVQLNKITTTKVTKFPGKSYDDVKNLVAARNMAAGYAAEYETRSGGGFVFYNDCLVPDYSGSYTDIQWQQIGDSNLYELIKTETSVSTSINRNIVRI